jgi:Domain of unknown function (DUF4126)
MEIIRLLGSVMGLGFVSGVNLYATVLTVGLGIRFGLIALNPELASLEILASPYILITTGVIYLVEFFADKIPWVDSLWDGVHTLIRPLGAAVLGATAIGSINTETGIIAALCGGVALSSHSAKAGTRLVANHSPEPFSNIALSLIEDILVVAGTWLALAHPLMMLALVLIFLAIFTFFAPKAFRLMRVEFLAAFSALKKLYASAKQYAYGFFKQPALAGAGSNNISVDVGEVTAYGVKSEPELFEDVPENYLYYLDNKIQLHGKQACIRCVAGKGVKGLRHSVGYLHLTDGNLIFVTRRSFRFRDHQIDRNSIEDIHFKRRILLDRLILRADGKQQQFLFFKDVSNRGEKVFGVLQVHKKQR